MKGVEGVAKSASASAPVRARSLPPEERLLVLLNLAAPSARERAEIRRLARAPGLGWERLLGLAELNAVLPLSIARLRSEKCLGAMPAEARARWESGAASIRETGVRRARWAGRLLEALASAGIPVIVLKGSMLADALYGDRAYKKMNDVDVMVRREDACRAIDALKRLGFQGVGALFGKDELSESSHHTPPYVSRDLACVVGLHWGLVSPRSPWKPDHARIWRRKSPAQIAGAPAYRMSWEDNLLHLCIHLPFFKTGLRELADVYNVALGGRIDWASFGRLVRRWGAQDPAYRVLALANSLVDLGIPPRMLREWERDSSRFTREDTAMRLARPASILESRCTQAARIEKAYAIFKLSGKYSERARAWAGMYALLLWPKAPELRKLTGRDGLRARIAAPARLWNAMARDHGHFPLIAMTAANGASLAGASLRKALRPWSPERSLREHPAAPLLEVLE